MTATPTRRGRVGLALFSLPFLLVGLGAVALGILPSLHDAWRMQGWQPVSAQVIHATLGESRGDDNSSWQAQAEYRYYAGGRERSGRRVAINDTGHDNVGSFQRDRAQELMQAQATGQAVTVWVNPKNPDEAVYHRGLRWELLGFYALFAFIFGGAGGGLLWWALTHRDSVLPEAPAGQPWLSRAEWASPVITTRARGALVMIWAFALFWSALSLPVTFALPGELARGNRMMLVAALFPLVGAGLLVTAVYLTLAARKFGASTLTLDPYPGRLGGSVGGDIVAAVPFQADTAFELTLSCLRIHTTGSGKNRRTSHTPLWQDTLLLAGEPTAEGHTRLWFSLAVPATLPASSAPSDDYTDWQLRLRADLPGIDYSRQWSLPVFACDLPAPGLPAARMRLHHAAATAALPTAPRVETLPDGSVVLDFPAGRRWGAALGQGLAGAIFSGAGVALFQTGDWLPRWGFAPLCGVIGLVLLASALWVLGQRLRVEGDRTTLTIRRWLFGLPLPSRQMALADVQGLLAVQDGSATVGNRHILYYRLEVQTRDGRRLGIGNGFHGERAARDTATAFARALKLPLPATEQRRALRSPPAPDR